MNLSTATTAFKGLFSVFLYLLSILISLNIYAQAPIKDSAKLGEVKGIVRDSAYNFVLSGATVAVYKDSDSSLLQFSIPNTFGEFSIKSLPVDILLRTIITHVGYRPFLQKFSIPKSRMVYDFGKINMFPKSGAVMKRWMKLLLRPLPPCV